MRLLDRGRPRLESLDLVVLAGKGHAPAGEKTLDDRQRLGHTIDANAGRIEWNPRLLIIRSQPARPQPEVKSTIRQEFQSRRLLGQHHRASVVFAEAERADPQ